MELTKLQLKNLKELVGRNQDRVKQSLEMDIPEDCFKLLRDTADSLFWLGELVEVLIEEAAKK